jgi:hypothetical protein
MRLCLTCLFHCRDPTTDKLSYSEQSPSKKQQWFAVVDDFLALCETEPNLILFATDDGDNSLAKDGGWERLALCNNKKRFEFPVRDLLEKITDSPNCCR